MPKVEWEKEALDDLQKIDRPIAKRILTKISWLSKYFDNIIPEPLSGDMSGEFKLRVGDWRVVYKLDHEDQSIKIYRIELRDKVYK